MPDWDWDWYGSDSGTETVPLLLSIRSQQLALSALNKMDSRSTWVEVDDATWDEIEAALAEAYEELIQEQDVIIQGTFDGLRAWRSTTQAVGTPVSTWNTVVFDSIFYHDNSYNPSSFPTGVFAAPVDGLYEINGQVQWTANASTTMRFSRILIDTAQVIALTGNAVASNIIYQELGTKIKLVQGQEIRLQCFTSVSALTIATNPDYGAVLTIERLR